MTNGDARVDESRSEIEFTKGMGGVMIRCGKDLPKASSRYRAGFNAKEFVGQALGHAKAFGIAVSDCASTVSISSSEAGNGIMVRSTCFETSMSKSGRLPPPSITSQPLRLLRPESRISGSCSGSRPSRTA